MLDVPNLELDPALLAQIQLLAASAVQSKSPESGQFIATDGTHYCHGMTQGTLRLSETEFSLAAEASAYENEVDIETEVKGDIEGVDLGTSASMSQSWSQKNVHEVSEEDITVFEVGEQGPMPVFLDLRPLTELFSPIFFPYRESNDWFKIAPAIWWDLRKSLGRLHRPGSGSRPRPRARTDDHAAARPRQSGGLGVRREGPGTPGARASEGADQPAPGR